MAFIPSIPIAQRTASYSSAALSSRTTRLNVVASAGAGVERREISRRALLVTLATIAGTGTTSLLNAANAAETGVTASGLGYTMVKKGTGPAAQVGDLVGIRFRGSYNGVVFDNLFDATTPYFYRVGSENILKGIDEAVTFMHVGDVYDLSLPSTLAFGKKGRRASAGKASIPPDASVDFTLELSSNPGREAELIESIDLE